MHLSSVQSPVTYEVKEWENMDLAHKDFRVVCLFGPYGYCWSGILSGKSVKEDMYRVMAIGRLVTQHNLVPDGNQWSWEQLGSKLFWMTSWPMAINLLDFERYLTWCEGGPTRLEPFLDCWSGTLKRKKSESENGFHKRRFPGCIPI